MAGPLVPSGSSSGGFRQTGVVNWTDLSTRTVEFGLGALNRFSKADVDVSTVATGQLICMSFEMPYENKKKILNHIQALPQISVYGTLLSYGLGLRHVIQDICDRDPGIMCVSLCGCLRENYDSFFGSQVLRFMCKKQNVPEDMIPGTQRWTALLKICAGLFATTEFPRLVYGLTHFVWPKPEYGAAQLGATNPEQLAEAILALGKISTGNLESCTFSGGIDCAWLGAVANYLFGLSVSVKQSDGLVSFQTKTGRRLFDAESQVNILQSQAGGSSIDILKTTVYLPNGKDMFRANRDTKKSDTSQFEIRTHWDSILKDSFGAATEELLKKKISNSLVRLMVFLVGRCPDRSIRKLSRLSRYRHNWPDMLYDQHALDSGNFLDFASSRLPELRPPIEEARQRQLSEVSESSAKESVRQIREACRCRNCTEETRISTERTCLVGLAFVIIQFAGLLSICKTHDISPAPLGLQHLYMRLESKLDSAHMGDIDVDLPTRIAPPDLWDPLWEIFSLFSSSTEARFFGDYDREYLAIGAEGICCFYEFTSSIKCHPSRVAKVVVMPGHIELAGSTYHTITDMRIERDDERVLRFTYPLLREYGFYISETREPNTLQMACRSKSTQGELSAFFNASVIVHWAQRRRLVHRKTCSDDPTLTSSENVVLAQIVKRNHQEMKFRVVWELDEQIYIPKLCQQATREPQPSLILITWSSNSLRVEKVTADHWRQPKADMSQLYAEYARQYVRLQGKLVQCDMAEISDCPQCILRFVWYTYTWPWKELDLENIRGSVAIHYPDKTIETKFRLQWLNNPRRSADVPPQSSSPPSEQIGALEIQKKSKKRSEASESDFTF